MTLESAFQDDEAYSRADIRIVEFDGDALEVEVETAHGTVAILATVHLLQNILVLDRVHVTGEGLNLGLIRRLAKVFGEVEDVEEVILQGGNRSSGANKGSSPTTIRVKVKS